MDVMPADMTAEARGSRASTAETPATVTMPGFSPQIDQIVPALVALNADDAWGNPPKNRHIQVYPADAKPFVHSYTDLPALLTHVRKTLAKHGFILVHQINGTNLTVTLLHLSGQYVRSAASVNPRQSTTHAIISEFTVMRRVMTGALLGIADGTTDDDGNAGAGHAWEERDAPRRGGDAPTGFASSAQMQERTVFKTTRDPTTVLVITPDGAEPFSIIVEFSTPEDAERFMVEWCADDCTVNYFSKDENAVPGALTRIVHSLDTALGESVAMVWASAAQAQSAEDFREIDRRINGEWADTLDAFRHTMPKGWQALMDHINREAQRFVGVAPAFSHVVFDGQGDAVNMPHTDPGSWSREFLECWDACDPSDRQALLDHNADAIADLVQHPSAHSLLLDVIQVEEAQAAPVEPPTVYLPARLHDDDIPGDAGFTLSFEDGDVTLTRFDIPVTDADEHPGASAGPASDNVDALTEEAEIPPEPPAADEPPPAQVSAPAHGTVSVVQPPPSRSGGIDRATYVALVDRSLTQCMTGADIEAWEEANRCVYEASERIGPTTQARVLRAIAMRRRALGIAA